MESPALLPRVLDVVRAAGRAILDVREGRALDVRQKVDGPVTAADLAANAILEAGLRPLAPDAAWLSEETADSSERLSCARVWVIDPLDGTQEFIQGTAHFGVSVALVEEGRPLVGAIYFPVTGEMLYAHVGGGAFEQGDDGDPRPLRVRDARDALVLATRYADMRKPWMQIFQEGLGAVRLKPLGSTVRKLAAVARGECDAYVSLRFSPYEWDICAGDLLVTEAGGCVTDLHGNVCRYNRPDPRVTVGLVASRADLHEGLMARARRSDRSA